MRNVLPQPRAVSIAIPGFMVVLLCYSLLAGSALALAAELIMPKSEDMHDTAVGYWDMRVCNWPDRPPFYHVGLSSERYDEIERVEVFLPNGKLLGEMDVKKYRLQKRKGKPARGLFVTRLPLHPQRPAGWYSAHITLKDGTQYLAKDFFIMHIMQRAGNHNPAHDAEVPVPDTLSWDPVPGAQRYRVFIRDMWNGGKQIYKSDLLDKPRLEMPDGLLEPAGWYSWRVHSRDTHRHVLLGFNHGSLTEWREFTTLDEAD